MQFGFQLPCIISGVTRFPKEMALSTFLAFVLILEIITCSTAQETCEKIDTCSCKLKNGSTVSLKPVDGGSKPRYKIFHFCRFRSVFDSFKPAAYCYHMARDLLALKKLLDPIA